MVLQCLLSIQESVLLVPLMAQIRSHLSYPVEFASDGRLGSEVLFGLN